MVTTPVIFLPGSLCDERVFADQLREIDQPCEVADLTLDDSIAAMAIRVLRAAPPRFALVGLSMGGIVASEIARLASERVLAMALLDTNLGVADDLQLRTRRRWASDVRSGRFAQVVEELVPALTISPEAHGPLIVEMATAVGPAGFLRQNEALLHRRDQLSIVSRFQGPILIACGSHDRLCSPRVHADLAARFAHARLLVVEQAGHLSSIDQPVALTRGLTDWLDDLNRNQTKRRRTHESANA
jgi:pimeloyl-ACP methyl ester carboxylesterase